MSITDKATLLRRWTGIVTGRNRVAVKQGVGKHYSKTKIEGYYNDLTGKVHAGTLLDDKGVPVNIIAGGRRVYFPISIFQYALGLWDLMLDGKGRETEDLRGQFLTICRWIVDSVRDDGSWDCFGPIGYRTLRVSSMGQGEAVSVLVRAHQLTGDQTYLAVAEKAIAFMLTDVVDGGTLRHEGQDVVFEEYPGTGSDKPAVLNGWIFSLFGLIDYLKVYGDTTISNTLADNIQTLKRHLSHYDCGYWSLYDRSGRIASPAYHSLHIALLTVLAELTDEPSLAETAGRWQVYEGHTAYRLRAIATKAIQKLHDNPEGIIIQ